MGRNTEGVFNVILADVLRDMHPRWHQYIEAEQTRKFVNHWSRQPDLLIHHPNGLPVIVETEFMPGRTVEDDAKSRLGEMLEADSNPIEQTIAVRIPQQLSVASQGDLSRLIRETTDFHFCVFSAGTKDAIRWPENGWLKGTVKDMAMLIEHASLSENRIASGVRILETGVAQASYMLREAGKEAPDTLRDIAEELRQQDCEQTSRMAMAIVANAMIFHNAIAGQENIKSIDELRNFRGRLLKVYLLEHWHFIYYNINYWPIFFIARQIMLPIPDRTAHNILNRLAKVASQLADLGTTSQLDLAGRMFQQLITDRKFLATFYTLPSSATLLAELAVSRLAIDWANEKAVTGLRIGDFACGTGALLNAAYGAVMARYRRAGGDDQAIHSQMMEHALVGADIMPSAVHLTATILSSRHPNITFGDTSIGILRYGMPEEGSGHKLSLGALDFLEDEATMPIWGTGHKNVHGIKEDSKQELHIKHGSFDLVIMNPPFTRPTGQEAERIGVPVPSFAAFGTEEEIQRAMSVELKKMTKPGMAGDGQAGLASNFIDLAHKKLKPGGVLALILPSTFIQGDAWEKSRKLIHEHYHDICIFSIAATGSTDRAFSADTGMAEVMVLATRRSKESKSAKTDAAYINLHRRPQSMLEAFAMGKPEINFEAGAKDGSYEIGEERVGNWIAAELSEGGFAGVRENDVSRFAHHLERSELVLPRMSKTVRVPLCPLFELGERGLYHMDLTGTEQNSDGQPRGPFEKKLLIQGEIPTYPMLWSHDAKRETSFIVEIDSCGRPRIDCEGRALKAWQKTATRLHFNRDFQLNSQPLAACITREPSIGGTAWPNFLCENRKWERILVLWANTTPGLIGFWWMGTRQQQGRARLPISLLPTLLTLDVRKLSSEQLSKGDEIFESFTEQHFRPANEVWDDTVRQDLDRFVLIDLLELPVHILEPLDLLRKQWCAEPTVHGGKTTRPQT